MQTIVVILTYRDRVNGLVLSELGGYLQSPDTRTRRHQTAQSSLALGQMVLVAH